MWSHNAITLQCVCAAIVTLASITIMEIEKRQSKRQNNEDQNKKKQQNGSEFNEFTFVPRVLCQFHLESNSQSMLKCYCGPVLFLRCLLLFFEIVSWDTFEIVFSFLHSMIICIFVMCHTTISHCELSNAEAVVLGFSLRAAGTLDKMICSCSSFSGCV